jgi:hypothetical protein
LSFEIFSFEIFSSRFFFRDFETIPKKQLVFYLTRVAVSKERFLSVCIFEKAESVATFVPNFLNLNDAFGVGMTNCGGDIAFGFSCGSKRFKIL